MKDQSSLDLHGYTVHEALVRFTDFYNDRVRRGLKGSIEVVHGYGSTGQGGAIQKRLREYLDQHSDRFESWLPGDALGNPGVTRIFPNKLLPATEKSANGLPSPLRDAILKQCETPKTREKVITKLCGRFGDRAVKEEIARMIQQGKLRQVDGALQQ